MSGGVGVGKPGQLVQLSINKPTVRGADGLVAGCHGRLARATCSHPLGGQLVRRFGKHALSSVITLIFFPFVFMDLIVLVSLMILHVASLGLP